MIILFIISSILSQMQNEIHSIYDNVISSEVIVKSASDNIISTGTVIDKNTVVSSGPIGKEYVDIVLSNGKKISGKVFGMDEYTGLTVINVKEDILKPPIMGKDINNGDILIIIGCGYNNMGVDGLGFFKGYTDEGFGIISLPISQGSNGAGIYNVNGELVGVLLGAIDTGIQVVDKKFIFTQWMNGREEGSIFIPVDIMFQRIIRIKKQGDIKKGWLGVKGENVNGEGVKIIEIIKDSPAEDAGFQKTDIITKIGHKNIMDMKELKKIIEHTLPGKRLRVHLKRQGEEIVKRVKIGAVPDRYKRIIIR